MNKEIVNALNEQINKEIFSAYLYLSMSIHLDSIGLKGMAHWMKIQYQEELMHADKIINYLISKGEKPELKEIKQPQNNWNSIVSIFEAGLKHEEYITQSINDIVVLTKETNDFSTFNFLQWFITEQNEEEEIFRDILDELKMIGDNKAGLFFIDKEMGQRSIGTNN